MGSFQQENTIIFLGNRNAAGAVVQPHLTFGKIIYEFLNFTKI